MEMGKILYMECHSGISGDMTVAALLDLGADREVLKKVLDSMPVKGFRTEICRVKKSGLDCMDFSVLLEKGYENHDHDMEYLHGHDRIAHINKGQHEKHHDEHLKKHQEGHHEGHHHEHRTLKDVLGIIEKTEMTVRAREIAKKTFQILAAAEAKAHGVPEEEVHFHEVGAVDSIVDIVSAAVCFDDLGITEVIVPEVCEGKGTVRCAHGIMPVPVPATAQIMEEYQLPVRFLDIQGEFVTPTGAALLAAMMTSENIGCRFRIEKTGLGAGKRNYELSGILRMMLIKRCEKEEEERSQETIYKLEANIDDCTGENLGYVMERLFEAGARDVHYTPVYMKKNRPGIQLNVICEKTEIGKMEQIIFSETTTIGIRRFFCERTVLPRKMENVHTKFGEVQIKVCSLGDEKRYYPEYESVANISREQGIPFLEVYMEALYEVRCEM